MSYAPACPSMYHRQMQVAPMASILLLPSGLSRIRQHTIIALRVVLSYTKLNGLYVLTLRSIYSFLWCAPLSLALVTVEVEQPLKPLESVKNCASKLACNLLFLPRRVLGLDIDCITTTIS